MRDYVNWRTFMGLLFLGILVVMLGKYSGLFILGFFFGALFIAHLLSVKAVNNRKR